jgi:FKBP-type peptidyl-prolyl cis-trans isomerase 2
MTFNEKGSEMKITRYAIKMVIALSLLCGNGVAAERPEEADRKAAMERLGKALEQARESGKPVSMDVEPEDPARVQAGDLVSLHYTASLEDGSLVYTTVAEVERDAGRKRSEGFRKNERPGPEEMVAGKGGFLPAAGSAAIGVKAGEKATVTLSPENAFGPRDPKKMAQFPCEKRMPRNAVLDPQSYVNRFGSFPRVGKEVDLTPYFKSRVTEVAENFVKLEALARGDERSEDSFGSTVVRIEGEQIVLTLTPRLGAEFEMNDRKGRIVSTDGTSFTVDFNPPLAGKSVVLDLEVVSLTKASAFKGMEIAWVEDHDKALEQARREGKPVFLLLYAAWCSWSKKILNESLQDPRIKMLKDRFVWAKVNSEEQKDIYELYDQKGYPLVVLLNPKGDVVRKIDGFRDGGVLAMELKSVVGGTLSLVRGQ